MPQYCVELYELHSQLVYVEADNEGAAIIAARNGKGEYGERTEFIENADKYAGNDVVSIEAANLLSDYGIEMQKHGRGIYGVRSVYEV